jgi:UDP-N-acetylmuramoyl-tripeptide--D-alanyl-D-alanine ligase
MAEQKWTIEDVILATGAKIRSGNTNAAFGSISTDTRSIGISELFVALVGENFNGHVFAEQAIEKGAGGLLVAASHPVKVDTGDLPVLEVDDTLFALGELARFHLDRLNVPVLAVTGSTGKTTTKEMLAEIMSAHFSGAILKTEGNYNNLIGLPLTVFGLGKEHRVAVLEMGMNMRGEIRRLAAIARPGIGVITNVSAVHLERLKHIDAVAQAKGELLEEFGENHIAVLNADDPRVLAMANGRDFKHLTFGIENPSDVIAENIVPKRFEGIDFDLKIGDAKEPVHLSCIGRHNVYNALAASAAAHAFEVPLTTIVEGLEAFRPPAMRSRILDIFGIKVIDDTYNANPSSMDAALAMLIELTQNGRSIAVLGDMYELGDESKAAHRRLGQHAAKLGLDKLYLVGMHALLVKEGAVAETMPRDAIEIFKTHREIVHTLREKGRRGDVILVKGSRGMRMERIVKGLKGESV